MQKKTETLCVLSLQKLKTIPTDKKSFLSLFFFIVLLLMQLFLNACSSDMLDNFEDENSFIKNEKHHLSSAMRPFEAWLMTPTLRTRSTNSEITELIEYEKERFDERFSFVEKYFKFIPLPQWESAKVVSYNAGEMDIFILCENNYPDRMLLNKLVLVISKRGNDVFSFIKMLPKDEYLSVSITAVNDGKNVHLMVNEKESDGALISQSLGYLTNEPAENEIATRSSDCENVLISYTEQTITTYGDGYYRITNHVDSYLRLVCSGGGGGGVYAPPPAAGAGSIPGYTPPSYSPPPGSPGGSTSNGGSGGSNYSDGSSYSGGSGYSGDAGYVGGGDFSGGGGISGGGSNNANYSTPQFPEGGINLLPKPESEDPSIRSHSLNKDQLELLLRAIKELKEEGCMQQALYDQLVNRKVKLDFGMYSDPTEKSAAANYDPRNKSISFRDNSTITKESLKEELFHAWQDAFYEGGIEQYGKDAQGNKLSGYVNVEFEAKFYKDILNNEDIYYGCCYAFSEDILPIELFFEYNNWICDIRDSIVDSGRDSEKIYFDDSVYEYWLLLFNEYVKEYSSPISVDLLKKSAIKQLIKNADC